MPQFLDWYYRRSEDGRLILETAPFLAETETEIRPEFEKEEGFFRWLTQDDIDSINNQFQKMLIEALSKEVPGETAGDSG